MAERIAPLGYVAVGKQSAVDTAVTPAVYVPAYNEDLTTSANYVEDNPIVGSKAKRRQVLPGMRSHSGSIEVMGEPNTAGYFFDMILKKGTTTGSGPYTHPFTLDATDPNSYTIDISSGHIVQRFWGFQASEIQPSYEENEMHLNIIGSGLGSFQSRKIASTSSGGAPTTVTLATDYDDNPTNGLVVGDLVQFWDGSAYVSGTVASVVDGTNFTTTEDWDAADAGDTLTLRPATPSFSLRTPFLLSSSEYRFAADAATALTAAQIRLETDTNWKVMHDFENVDGSVRTGDKDPASLVRLQGDIEFNVKRFFDTPDEQQRYQDLEKRAVVIRHFTETQAYELRVTINDLRAVSNPKPSLTQEEVLYSEIEYKPVEEQSDGQMYDVKVINNVAVI